MSIAVKEQSRVSYEEIPVNVEEEIAKMAQADGIAPTKAKLAQSLTVTRREYYAASIKAYYRGRDEGYVEGVRMIGRPIR